MDKIMFAREANPIKYNIHNLHVVLKNIYISDGYNVL